MQTFKKVLLSSIAFLLVVVLLVSVILVPWEKSKSEYYMDADTRTELAGSLDYLVIGASHAMTGFIPEIIDKEFNVSSYNLSNVLMTIYAKNYFLKKEIGRNPIKTVVLEISNDSLSRDQKDETGEGDSVSVLRLDSIKEKANYLLKYVTIDDLMNVLCKDIIYASSYWLSLVSGKPHKSDFSVKGYQKYNSGDVTLSEKDIVEKHKSEGGVDTFIDENIKEFEESIKICQENGCNVIVTTVPVSDAILWKTEGNDAFHSKVSDICDKYNVSYYDFNLSKEKFNLFNDDSSFNDEVHLAGKGAEAFTNLFCDIIKKVDMGVDVSGLFYSSYDEMLQDSPYMQYYLQNSK